jgi:imidazolonepropionase-like amidohydrolase
MTMRTLTASVALSMFCCGPVVAQVTGGSAAPLALVGGTIYVDPVSSPIRNGVVLIQNGRIAGVGSKTGVRLPRGVQTIDCTGMTITAGFWNSHVHFFERKWADAAMIPAADLDAQLQEMLTRYGFTSVWDTWSMWDNTLKIRKRIESGEVHGPRIRSTGEAIFGRGAAAAAGSQRQLGMLSGSCL